MPPLRTPAMLACLAGAWALGGAGMAGGVAGGSAGGAIPSGLGQLIADGQAVCTATVVAPGWALTAGHCLDAAPRALRLFAAQGELLPLGAARGAPGRVDLALVSVPGAAGPLGAVTSVRSYSPTCSSTPRGVTIHGAAHGGGLRPGRTPVAAPAVITDECAPDQFTAMLIVPPGLPAAGLCTGDSGSPVLGADGTVQAVVVAKAAGAAGGRCATGRNAIGYAETLNEPSRHAWLASVLSAGPLPLPITAVVVRAAPTRVWLAIGPRGGSLPAGTVVRLIGPGGRLAGRTVIGTNGLASLRRPRPGTYRMRATSPDGTVITRALRIRPWRG